MRRAVYLLLLVLAGCKSWEVVVQTSTLPLAVPAVMLEAMSRDIYRSATNGVTYSPKLGEQERSSRYLYTPESSDGNDHSGGN